MDGIKFIFEEKLILPWREGNFLFMFFLSFLDHGKILVRMI